MDANLRGQNDVTDATAARAARIVETVPGETAGTVPQRNQNTCETENESSLGIEAIEVSQLQLSLSLIELNEKVKR